MGTITAADMEAGISLNYSVDGQDLSGYIGGTGVFFPTAKDNGVDVGTKMDSSGFSTAVNFSGTYNDLKIDSTGLSIPVDASNNTVVNASGMTIYTGSSGTAFLQTNVLDDHSFFRGRWNSNNGTYNSGKFTRQVGRAPNTNPLELKSMVAWYQFNDTVPSSRERLSQSSNPGLWPGDSGRAYKSETVYFSSSDSLTFSMYIGLSTSWSASEKQAHSLDVKLFKYSDTDDYTSSNHLYSDSIALASCPSSFATNLYQNNYFDNDFEGSVNYSLPTENFVELFGTSFQIPSDVGTDAFLLMFSLTKSNTSLSGDYYTGTDFAVFHSPCFYRTIDKQNAIISNSNLLFPIQTQEKASDGLQLDGMGLRIPLFLNNSYHNMTLNDGGLSIPVDLGEYTDTLTLSKTGLRFPSTSGTTIMSPEEFTFPVLSEATENTNVGAISLTSPFAITKTGISLPVQTQATVASWYFKPANSGVNQSWDTTDGSWSSEVDEAVSDKQFVKMSIWSAEMPSTPIYNNFELRYLYPTPDASAIGITTYENYPIKGTVTAINRDNHIAWLNLVTAKQFELAGHPHMQKWPAEWRYIWQFGMFALLTSAVKIEMNSMHYVHANGSELEYSQNTNTKHLANSNSAVWLLQFCDNGAWRTAGEYVSSQFSMSRTIYKQSVFGEGYVQIPSLDHGGNTVINDTGVTIENNNQSADKCFFGTTETIHSTAENQDSTLTSQLRKTGMNVGLGSIELYNRENDGTVTTPLTVTSSTVTVQNLSVSGTLTTSGGSLLTPQQAGDITANNSKPTTSAVNSLISTAASTINSTISTLGVVINSKPTTSAVNSLISTAASTINASISTLAATVNDNAADINTNNSKPTTSAVNSLISTAASTINSSISTLGATVNGIQDQLDNASSGSSSTFYDVKTAGFASSSTTNWIPWHGTNESSSSSSPTGKLENCTFIAPYNGVVKKLMFRSETLIYTSGFSFEFNIGLYKGESGDEVPVDLVGTPVLSTASLVDDTTKTFSSLSGWDLVEGKLYAVKLILSDAPIDTTMTMVIQYTI